MTTSVVMAVYNQLALTRACLTSWRETTTAFELSVVDNASTDGTAEYFREFSLPFPLTYRRNDDNVGLIRALNQGARQCRGEFVCFVHNDTETRDARWLERLRSAVESPRGVGLAGLYGAQKLRADGRYAGRTLIHCLDGEATIDGEMAEVAAVDGVCLFMRRALFDSLGGFDESYGFFHGYDRDLSFSVREAGWRCAVVNAPFVHRGGGTRTGREAPVVPAADLAQRREALARFAAKWRHRLPSDVRGVGQRVGDWLAAPRTRA